jgi:hypothetical protein
LLLTVEFSCHDLFFSIGPGGELLFQIINSSDFYFRFNQSTSFQRLEIVDRSLSSQDLCRISNIPSHIPIKLLYDNQCSCTVYYLYRHLRHQLLPRILQELTPLCYFNMSLNEIEQAENECSFKNKIFDCQQMEGEIQIHIPQGLCQENSKLTKNSSFVFLFMILGCLIITITCICILFFNNQTSLSFRNFIPKYFHHYRRQKSPIYSVDSHQQESRRKLIVKYNSTTEDTQPYLDIDQSNEDLTLKLNTNPMSDIEDNI